MSNHWQLNRHLPGLPFEPAPGVQQHRPVDGTDNECICGKRFYSYRELRQHGLELLSQPLPEKRAALRQGRAA